MSENVELPQDGRKWWQKLLGVEVTPTSGEMKANSVPGSTPDSLMASQEMTDARRLIQLGIRTGDQDALKVGKARLRTVMGKDPEEDK